ncbi:MAG: ATP-binding cassette domain-containing protein [Clostridia bacterium]|nr:ATP-binding cassette domain-containing protein [Clostridia bacterium]MBQ2153145.1 ATP-binding cassette domain-containing protein [Clostridia bacterium]
MIEVKNITKCYGDKVAVDNVSFTAPSGEILGFLGPNGAGKSTTMNIITGYLSSSSGTVTIDGCEILEDPKEAKSKIGYLPEIPPLYMDMTVQKYLEFMFDLKKVKLDKEEHIEEVCRLVKISSVTHRLIKNLSKGYKQRVGLAQALLGNPPVLILDEPTVGLDPKQIIEIRNLVKSLGKKHTVILSSHILSEVQAICDRVVIISNGKVVADETTDGLSQKLGKANRLLLEAEGNKSKIIDTVSCIPDVKSIKTERELGDNVYEFSIDVAEDADIRRRLFFAMAAENMPILTLRSDNISLEEAFLRLTNDTQYSNKRRQQ